MLSLTLKDFNGTRLTDTRNILAVFYASWCPFCRRFLTVFESTMAGSTRPLGGLVDISEDSNPLWERFRVGVVPTLVGFREGLAFVRKDGVPGVGLGKSELEVALREMEKR